MERVFTSVVLRFSFVLTVAATFFLSPGSLLEKPYLDVDPAFAEEDLALVVSFEVAVQEVSICGERFSRLTIETDTPGIRVGYEEFDVPFAAGKIVLPANLAHLRGEPFVASRSKSPIPELNWPLLPLLQPTSSEESTLVRYCRAIHDFYHEISAIQADAISVVTPLLHIELTPSRQARITYVADQLVGAPRMTSNSSVQTVGGATGIEYLIIYTPDAQTEAQRLRDIRVASGMQVMLQNVVTLPGYQPGDAIPPACQGDYLRECYFVAGDTISVDPAVVPGLYGMVNHVVAGESYERVPDLAGLIRAAIRQTKTDNPSLRYVALVGDPQLLPPRFTTQTDADDSGLTLPSDSYFQEPFIPWTPTGYTNRVKTSPLVYPDPLIFDTSLFVWPIKHTAGRTFRDAFSTSSRAQFANALDNGVAVGRIHKKGPLDVVHYLDKLQLWEANPQPLMDNNIAFGADGIYEKADLAQFEDILGSFQFFGEGFGTGYNSAPSGDCLTEWPTSNDWHAMGDSSGAMGDYQEQDEACKPSDPSMPGFTYPDPAEMLLFAGQNGACLFSMQGHGGGTGIAVNTHAYNANPKRSISTPLRPSAVDYDRVLLDEMAWGPGVGVGFAISGACNPGEYLGGPTRPWIDMKTNGCFAEYLLSLDGAGTIGSYFNFFVGYYFTDPAWDMYIFDAIATVHQNTTNRIGDAILLGCKNGLLGVGGIYQYQNRTYFGDPAATIARN